jgi:HEPN domain-containing protein
VTQRTVDNWPALAEYDLATAQAMLQAGRLLYVGFMCQQAIEKILKACYVQYRGATIVTLNSYYIESCYTEDIQELAKTSTETRAKEVLASTRELFGWIKSKL